MELNEQTILHTPRYINMESNGINVLVDPEGPNWISTDRRGVRILSFIDGKRSFNDIVKLYCGETGNNLSKAWLHVNSFIKDVIREKFVSNVPFTSPAYTGRENHLSLDNLKELWIHTNNSCNLQCTHCLVSSGPWEDKGLPGEDILDLIDQARDLGVKRFFFTGGEPFVRKDIYELIEYVTRDPESELIVLTNGMLFTREQNMKKLREAARGRMKPQISLDGSTPEANDPIRGKGTFEKITRGIKAFADAGFDPTVTTVITSSNSSDVSNVTRLISELGVTRHHLLWLHQRGRITDNGGNSLLLPVKELIQVVRDTKNTADELGIKIDNFESVKERLMSRKYTRYDLSNACWESLCVYSDGKVYPSAVFANYEGLVCGDIKDRTLESIWKNSPVCRMFRSATVQKKSGVLNSPLKFISGGGDIEHSYFYSASTLGKGDLQGPDPYIDLHDYIIRNSLFELATDKKRELNHKSGFDAPCVFIGMGEGALSPGNTENGGNGIYKHFSEPEVKVSHSNCVLSFNMDKSREVVRRFYGNAAEEPQKELCCPASYPADDISHIPQDVIDRFYGCGSPVSIAGIEEGETMVDLGSGAGIDCFIAARKTGSNGKVIGVDMTEQMLGVANDCSRKVADNLGYDVVEFRKGFLEDIPVDNKSVDLITSNCVINLSPDKKKVFAEMWRVLNDHGRIVVSDIVSEKEVPPYIVTNDQLWGQCIAGALTEEQFKSYLEKAGFYGLQVLKKEYWKSVDNYAFYSVTVRGYKFEKTDGCVFIGQKAIYNGPFKSIVDEEGHMFPRGEAVEICTDTAEKLSKPPYKGMFIITDPDRDIQDIYMCCSDGISSCC